MGAGATLKRAIADVRALPPDAPERRLALPVLVCLRLEILSDPAEQTKSDREFLMKTVDVEKYPEQIQNKGREEGREEGRSEGFAQAVLAAYRARFGAPPAELVAAVERARDRAERERWLQIVTTQSVDEVTAALRRRRARSMAATARSTKARRSPSPRRATAAR